MPDRQIAEIPDFREELKKQFRFIEANESSYKLADFIIDSLDESGFLLQDLDAIAEEISFKQNIWVQGEILEPVLKKVQQLDPLGCGSRNLGEFFEIELMKVNGNQLVIKLPRNLCVIIFRSACLQY
jgi:RNA polymerase sigma-54 factor